MAAHPQGHCEVVKSSVEPTGCVIVKNAWTERSRFYNNLPTIYIWWCNAATLTGEGHKPLEIVECTISPFFLEVKRFVKNERSAILFTKRNFIYHGYTEHSLVSLESLLHAFPEDTPLPLTWR